MSISQTVYGLVSSDAGVIALAGERVSSNWRRQGETLPAVSLTRAGGLPDVALSGVTGLTESHFQADCWAASQIEAQALAAAVKAAFQGARPDNTGGVIQGAFVEAETDSFEGESADRICRTMLTIQVWHREP